MSKDSISPYYKLYFYIIRSKYKQYINNSYDIVHDFITYKEIPSINKDKLYIMTMFENYLNGHSSRFFYIDDDNKMRTKNKKIKGNIISKVEYLEGHDYDLNDEGDIEDRKSFEDSNLERIEVVIDYVSKLNSLDKCIFQDFFINKMRYKELIIKYNKKRTTLSLKISRFKRDIIEIYKQKN